MPSEHRRRGGPAGSNDEDELTFAVRVVRAAFGEEIGRELELRLEILHIHAEATFVRGNV
jgi:hypothetical protein